MDDRKDESSSPTRISIPWIQELDEALTEYEEMKKQLNSVLQEKEEELEKNNQKLLTLGALLNDEEGNLSEEERKNHTLEVIKLSAATIRLREQVTSTKAMMKSDVERERKWTKDFQKIEQELESVKRKFSQLD